MDKDGFSDLVVFLGYPPEIKYFRRVHPSTFEEVSGVANPFTRHGEWGTLTWALAHSREKGGLLTTLDEKDCPFNKACGVLELQGITLGDWNADNRSDLLVSLQGGVNKDGKYE